MTRRRVELFRYWISASALLLLVILAIPEQALAM